MGWISLRVNEKWRDRGGDVFSRVGKVFGVSLFVLILFSGLGFGL